MEMATREARAKEVGGRLHRPPRPQGTNPPDGTTTTRAPGQAPHVGHVTVYNSKFQLTVTVSSRMEKRKRSLRGESDRYVQRGGCPKIRPRIVLTTTPIHLWSRQV